MPADTARKTARVFFALWPAPDAAKRLAVIARAEAGAFGGRPTRSETIHLTLAFVGDVDEERLPALVGAAEAVRGEAFALQVDRLGYWAHNHLRWAGCSRVPPALGELAGALREALLAAGFPVDRPPGGLVPHVTLVRRMAAAAPPGPIEPIVAWHCPEFALVRSHRLSAGASYERLHVFPLT